MVQSGSSLQLTFQDPSVAVILGSAFSQSPPQGLKLEPVTLDTPWGAVTLYRTVGLRRSGQAYVIFRHSLPHQVLPHLVNFRAYAAALKQVRCSALLVTSSVGVLDQMIPLDQPMFVTDLLMPDNRLPTGELCTMFTESSTLDLWPSILRQALRPGHLVLKQGLFSSALYTQLSGMLADVGINHIPNVTFAYAPGPRTKTPVENQYWRHLGAHVNSMSVGPEVILANELEIPTVALVIGHKRSRGTMSDHTLETNTPLNVSSSQLDKSEMTATLERSHHQLEAIVIRFLQNIVPVKFQNYIYRFSEP